MYGKYKKRSSATRSAYLAGVRAGKRIAYKKKAPKRRSSRRWY